MNQISTFVSLRVPHDRASMVLLSLRRRVQHRHNFYLARLQSRQLIITCNVDQLRVDTAKPDVVSVKTQIMQVPVEIAPTATFLAPTRFPTAKEIDVVRFCKVLQEDELIHIVSAAASSASFFACFACCSLLTV